MATSDYIKTTTLVDDNGNTSTGYYDTAKQAYAELLENAKKQNAESANAQITTLQNDANDYNKGLWTTYQQQLRKAPQQLAASGITGGAAESSIIGAGNNYLNNIAEQARTLQEQKSSILQNQASGDNDAYTSYMNNLLALYKDEQDQALADKADDKEAAMTYGDNTGDYSYLANYGYTGEQIALLNMAWKADNAEKYATMYSTQTGTGTGNSQYTLDEVLDALNEGTGTKAEKLEALTELKLQGKISQSTYSAAAKTLIKN